MKKILASVVALGCLAAAGSAIAGVPAATGVNGSVHDMNTFIVGNNADSMARVCVFCHTPHHAQSNLAGGDTAPLWDRDASQLNYQPYVWVTPANQGTDADSNAFAIVDPLAGPSRLCMSCHDGVVAVDSHGGTMSQVGSGAVVTARANLGADLTQTHPIGFDYIQIKTRRNAIAGIVSASAGATDSEIVDETNFFATEVTPVMAQGNATNQGVYNPVVRAGGSGVGTAHKRIKDVLFGGNIMTCASCHEVHNKENATQELFTGANGSGTTTAPNYLLYAKEARSLICLSCHVK